MPRAEGPADRTFNYPKLYSIKQKTFGHILSFRSKYIQYLTRIMYDFLRFKIIKFFCLFRIGFPEGRGLQRIAASRPDIEHVLESD